MAAMEVSGKGLHAHLPNVERITLKLDNGRELQLRIVRGNRVEAFVYTPYCQRAATGTAAKSDEGNDVTILS